jgi:5'(3')-deoxyribonucleotidase
MKKQIFLDMDGVLVNFDQGVRDRFKVDWHPEEFAIDYKKTFNMSKSLFWSILDNERFWANLPWTEYGKRVMRVVEIFRPCILSTVVVPAGFSGKVKWLKKNYPAVLKDDRVLFSASTVGETHNSKRHCAGPGSVLIDDNEKMCENWRAAGGEAIMWPTPWNSYRGVSDPIEYLMSSLALTMVLT